jgi:TonB-linked SusC/RagA family outer membrane protein
MNLKKSLISSFGMIAVTALFLLVLNSVVSAQNFKVNGKVVTAENQTPLAGVNILEVDTQNGTTTDQDGNFSITVSSKNARLRFTFIGYKTQVVKVNGKSQITVQMQSKVSKLNQVVVTALGITKQKKSLGYSVSNVEPSDIVTSNVTNTSNLLQGQVAGVHVQEGSGGPGSASRVTIRGVSSLNGNNQPLYVVDGIPIDNSNFFSAGQYNGRAGGNGIAMIDPQDIKSISVLKGASASALYGSRARNGVIEITTKSGKGAKNEGPQVDINSTVTVSSMLSNFTDYQHTYGQGSQGVKPGSQSAAITDALSSWGAKYDGSEVPNFYGGTSKYIYHPNQAGDFYRNATTSRNSLSLSGGTDNSSYYFNATHQFAPSIFPNSNLKRTNLTLRGTHTFFGKLHADVKANYIRQHHHNLTRVGDSPGNAASAVFQLPGNVSLASMKNHYIKDDGTEYNIADANAYINNPYWVVNQFNTLNDKNRFIGFVKLTYDFTPWLSVIGRTGIDTYKLRHNFVVPYGTIWRVDGSMNIEEDNVLENDTDVMLKIKHAITSSLSLDATFGAAREFHRTETLGANGTNFKVPGLRTISNMADITNVYGYSSKQINSLYGMIDLSYKDYLFITGTGRNDWSSTLPEANNSYFYPSASGSFVFSEALSSIMPEWLTFGKLRASWAVVGSDTDPYQLALTYGLLPFTHGGQSLAVVSQASIPLSTLKPTKTKAIEVGLNMSFVNDRIGFDLALYKRKTINQILSTSVSVTSGYSDRMLNAGRLDNKGIELSLTGKPVLGENVSWNTSFNFTSDHSKVKALAEDQQTLQLAQSRSTTASITATVGQQYGTIRGTKFKRDDDGNLILNKGLPQPTDDKYILGRGTPSWTAGWNNTVHYKNWSLNFMFDTNWGGQIYSGTNQQAMNNGLLKKTLIGRVECDEAGTPYSSGCFVPKGVNSDGSQNKTGVTPAGYYGQIATQIASAFVYDANYIKFRQAKLSYSLPQEVVGRTPLHSVTLSVVGRNLAYIYNSVPNIDPEAAINAGNAQGLELAGLPATRSIGFDIDIKF